MLSQRNCNYGYASRLPATLTGTKNVRKREFPNRGKFTKKQRKINHFFQQKWLILTVKGRILFYSQPFGQFTP